MQGARRGRQRGLTLVELLVALVISLMLMTGLIQIFIANKVTYRTQEGLARLQENGRYAMQRLGRSIRMAGYFGCPGLEVDTPNVLANTVPADLASITNDTPVGGLDDVVSGNPFGAAAGTDVVTLRGAGENGVGMVSGPTAINAAIVLNAGNATFASGDLVLFTDCRTADLVRATGVATVSGVVTIAHAGSANSSANLSKPYGADAVALRPYIHSYYVRDSGRDNAAGDDILAFYMIDMNGTEQELVEGVSDMQVLYGVDQDDDRAADIYLEADAVNGAGAWGEVVSVRVALLLDSVENVLEARADYLYSPDGNAPLTPADAGDFRLRQEFASVFTLRNRAL